MDVVSLAAKLLLDFLATPKISLPVFVFFAMMF